MEIEEIKLMELLTSEDYIKGDIYNKITLIINLYNELFR